MLSSWQIAQLHAQQGQVFAAQQQQTQALSAMMPPPYGGFANPMPPFSAGAFGAGPGSGYNYGAARDNRGFANLGMSVMGGIGHAAFGGMAIQGAMMGGSAMGGFSGLAAGGAGRVLGGAAVGGALGFGVGAIGGHVVNAAMEGAQAQQQLERTMSQFRFQNAGAHGGHGFSTQDMNAIGNMVRSMSRIPEMLTSFGELNQLMDKMGQMGLMQNLRSVGEFSSKFQSTINTLRDMAKMMGTTMEGALQAFGESRQAGFYTNQAQLQNLLNRQVTSGMTGMTMEQTGRLQAMGAGMSHARGGSRIGGAQMFTRQAQLLGAGVQTGIISADTLTEMTGLEGPEAQAEMAGQMGDLAYRMMNSNVGTAVVLGLSKLGPDGKPTGAMDPELVQKYQAGQLSTGELIGRGRQISRTRGGMLGFAAHRNRLTTEAANALGPMAVPMILKNVLGERGFQDADALNLVLQQFGATEEQSNFIQNLAPHMRELETEMATQRRQEIRNNVTRGKLDQYSWEAFKHKLSTRIKHVTTDWAEDIGVSIRKHMSEWVDDYFDSLSGTYRMEATGLGVNLLRQQAMGRVTPGWIGSGASRSLGGTAGTPLNAPPQGGTSLTRPGDSGISVGTEVMNQRGMPTAGRASEILMRTFAGAGGGQFMQRQAALKDRYGEVAHSGDAGVTEISRTGLDQMADYYSGLGGRASQIRGGFSAAEQAAYGQALTYVQELMTKGEYTGAGDDMRKMAVLTEGLRGKGFGRAAGLAVGRAGGGTEADVAGLVTMIMEDPSLNRRGRLSAQQIGDVIRKNGTFLDAKTVRDDLKSARDKLGGQLPGGEGKGFSGAQIEEELNKSTGSIVARLMGMNEGGASVFDNRKVAEEILATDYPTDSSRKLLASFGITDPKEVAAFYSKENSELRGRLMETVNQGKGKSTGDAVRALINASMNSTVLASQEQLKQQGKTLTEATDMETGTNAARLKALTKGGKDTTMTSLIGHMHTLGELQSRGDVRPGATQKGTQEVTAAVRDYQKLVKGKSPGEVSKIAAALTSADTTFAYVVNLAEQQKRLEEKGRDWKKTSIEDLTDFGAEFGRDAAGQDKYGEILKGGGVTEKEGKHYFSSKEEFEKAKQSVLEARASGVSLAARPGKTTGTTAVNEADIAHAMAQMSVNTLATTQLIANLMGKGGAK